MAPESLSIDKSGLSAARQALLSKLLGGNVKPSTHSARHVITPRPAGQTAQLSFAQQRLWYLTQLEPESPLYNMPAALRLSGRLDVPALVAAINEIVRRHEVLRTTFCLADGQPAQFIAEQHELPIPVTDLSGLDAAAAEDEMRLLVRQEARLPFRLEHDVPVRGALIRLAPDEHVMLLTLHHIAADAWSMGVLVHEFAALYACYASDRAPALKAIPVQYADYAHWQRKWLTGDVLEKQLAYWKSRLEGGAALLELPTDFPRPAIKTDNGRTCELVLDKALTQGLEALCKRSDTTMYMLMLAAFGTLLSRYSGQRDVCIGTAIANRTRSELEGLIGFFINTLVMRLDLSGNPRFLDLLAATRETAMGAYAHQDLPFEQLVEAINPERNMSYSPLFQVTLIMQNAPSEVLQLPGLALHTVGGESTTAKYDISLRVTSVGETLLASFEYNTDLFRHETMERMAGHLQVLLAGIVRAPEDRLSELSMISPAEQQQLLVGWNRTARDYPNACVHTRFEQLAAQAPQATAVSCNGQSLSYHELNARANQVATYLHAQGVATDMLVGLCMERSLDMVVGMLGILKAGAAYLPLDVNYPAERLAYMVQDSGIGMILSQASLGEKLASLSGRHILLDSDWPMIAAHGHSNPGLAILPANLAYCIYTSGSTGRPKGVGITHQAIMRLVFDTEYVNVQPHDTVAQVSNSSFDAATFEIWTSLLHGAALHIITQETMLSPADFVAQVRQHGIRVMCLTPAFFVQVIRAVPDAFSGLKHLLVGGESLDPQAARQLLLQPPANFTNGYGPTESTTFATTYPVRQVNADMVNIPIGRPIANTRVYIVDEDMQPCAVGIAGELCIAGDGLARGYLKHAALTAEKFVPNPFEGPGVRMYRTGDRARYLATGEIECLGRFDNQVKLRGFRIELGEIEARLSEMPGVTEAAVLVREDVPGNRRLVAYVAGLEDGPHEEKSAWLRERLGVNLPEHMVPAAYVFLPRLPLTPNGKVDRRALPAPDTEASRVEAEYVAPRNKVEMKLAAVWASALSLERVGIHDNFYTLGGDSLLSMQVIAHAQAKGIRFSPRQIMEYQTIAELAAVVSESAPDAVAEDEVLDSVPLSPRQQWSFELEVQKPHYFNTWGAIGVLSDFQPELMQKSLEHLYTVHDALRLRFRRTSEGWVQFLAHSDLPQGFSTVDLSAMPRAQQLKALEEAGSAAHQSLDLEAGPLLKVIYFKLDGQGAGRLLFVAHHLILDGFGLQVLTRDLSKLHSQAVKGKPFQLPAKTTSFQEWVNHMTAFASSGKLHPEMDYWRNIGKAGITALPLDHFSGENLEMSARTLELRLSADETNALQLALRAQSAGLTDAVIAAITLAITRWTGNSTLLLELAQHGREMFAEGLDLTGTVGWLTANFPVPLQLEPQSTPAQALAGIQTQLANVPNQGVGYGLLRYSSGDMAIKRELEALPQAQVFFNYLGQMSASRPDEKMGEREYYGPHRCPIHRRSWLIYCKARMAGRELVVQWEYTQDYYRRETIEGLGLEAMRFLRQLTAQLTPMDALVS